MRRIKAREMELGDVVMPLPKNIDDIKPFDSSIVRNIDKESKSVTLYRPHGTTADFTYIGGVLCYVGIEEYPIWLNSDVDYLLLDRRTTPLK